MSFIDPTGRIFIPKRRGIGVLLTAGAFLVAGCSGGISRGELQAGMRQAPPPLIVDVRSDGEYARDHIPGAMHIPFYSIGSGIEAAGVPKNGRIVLYCEHGPRAGIAGISLYLHGYRDVLSLEGHMKGWRDAGLPVEKSAP